MLLSLRVLPLLLLLLLSLHGIDSQSLRARAVLEGEIEKELVIGAEETLEEDAPLHEDDELFMQEHGHPPIDGDMEDLPNDVDGGENLPIDGEEGAGEDPAKQVEGEPEDSESTPLEGSMVQDEDAEDEMQELMDEDAYLAELSEKLAPVKFHVENNNLAPHSFLHLHHMKTGGTSMDGLLNCAMRRMKQDSTKIQYMNIHECGLQHYRSCRDGVNPKCRNSINASSILSYCAPLMDLEKFGWNTEDGEDEDALIPNTVLPTKPHAVTVLRHPINRVWSMYRFQTKRCYSCKSLTQIYEEIDSGTHDVDEGCAQQLLNHQTRNLVQEWDDDDTDMMLQGALHNLHNFFTFVGLTEQMNDTATMVGKVFPFMNETIASNPDAAKCPMPHRNASPQNNRCGPGGTHMALPPHPDDATAEVIMKHNPMDVALYEEAEKLFEYQKIALGLKVVLEEDEDGGASEEDNH